MCLHVPLRCLDCFFLQFSGLTLKPWLLVEMRGDPLGAETDVREVTSLVSVPWSRQEGWVRVSSIEHDRQVK